MPQLELRGGRLQPEPRARWSRGDQQKQPGGRAAIRRSAARPPLRSRIELHLPPECSHLNPLCDDHDNADLVQDSERLQNVYIFGRWDAEIRRHNREPRADTIETTRTPDHADTLKTIPDRVGRGDAVLCSTGTLTRQKGGSLVNPGPSVCHCQYALAAIEPRGFLGLPEHGPGRISLCRRGVLLQILDLGTSESRASWHDSALCCCRQMIIASRTATLVQAT